MSDNKEDISEFFREVPPFLKVFNITNAYPTDDDQFIVEFSPGEELTHSNGMVVQGGFVTGMLDCCMAQFLIYKAKGKQIPLTLDIDVKFLRPVDFVIGSIPILLSGFNNSTASSCEISKISSDLGIALNFPLWLT